MVNRLIIISVVFCPWSVLRHPMIFLSTTHGLSPLSALLFVGSISGCRMQVNQKFSPFSILLTKGLNFLYEL